MGTTGNCLYCNGMLFDSEKTPFCGDCLLKIRESFGIRIVGKDIFYKVAEKRWVKCAWPYRGPKVPKL